jgi:hypothetical protein
VTLGAVSDDGNGLTGQLLQVTILLVENSVHVKNLFSDM